MRTFILIYFHYNTTLELYYLRILVLLLKEFGKGIFI